ncbi:MAG: exodeoxyribonuclease VII small subunit [Bacilli bacterium]|jgi:exodeoxyribonuclease VII small subunit|nr:exodeoxyribonuclease VII small subunit [Bacilli bacterium]MCH4202127.1 exodeoxyribonuclease VII small subunit [Bacilli bacterium]MCH4235318.1 exodeoxyribonuclease VII small subunit [Bacilli bacterium]
MENNKKSFAERLSRLDEIVKELEGGEVELEKSLTLFKEGNELVKVLEKELNDAKTEIVRVTEENTEK